jgi:GDPmannose 4,6-dehydratase
MAKKALITGITGQDGSYLAEFLLEKGYEVHGIKRRASSFNTGRIDHIYTDIHADGVNLFLHFGDLTDSTNLIRIIQMIEPVEIYNLGAQSHVAVSFETPEYTANADALGALRILEAIRLLGLTKKTKFYQASTSELFGTASDQGQQSERSMFRPQSPYATAKLYAYWITANYRDAYGIFACNGILFNHESERRGETFVSKKISQAVARIRLGLQEKMYLGNINAYRDWGHAREYVEAMWLMLQADVPQDLVIATGKTHTVKDFVNECFKVHDIEVVWEVGDGNLERAYVVSGLEHLNRKGPMVVDIDPKLYRPLDVEYLCGDSTKARRALGWEPKIHFRQLVQMMALSDYNDIKRKTSVSK